MPQFDDKSNSNLDNYKLTHYTFRSQTLNPQKSQSRNKYRLTSRNSMLRKQDRKRRLQQILDNRYKSMMSATLSRQGKSKQKFKPFSTINAIVRERHKIEEKTQKIQNCAKYMFQRVSIQTRKNQLQKLKQKRRRQIISQSKTYRSRIEQQIQKINQSQFNRKLQSKTIILHHKKALEQRLAQSQLQKSNIAQIVRSQSKLIDEQVYNFREMSRVKNRQAYQKEKKFEADLQRSRIQRQKRLRKMSQDNYKNRWMNELSQKQKVQKQNIIRAKALQKKMQNLLRQTQKIEWLSNHKQPSQDLNI